jgi:hypothetical protein
MDIPFPVAVVILLWVAAVALRRDSREGVFSERADLGEFAVQGRAPTG